jgi:hypothetical protein
MKRSVLFEKIINEAINNGEFETEPESDVFDNILAHAYVKTPDYKGSHFLIKKDEDNIDYLKIETKPFDKPRRN